MLSVLQDGPEAYSGTTARTNEKILDITPPRFYAFAGRTHADFGKAAFMEPLTARLKKGLVSPFDTGGLVEHFPPVSGWDQVEKRKFLLAFSWPATDIAALLKAYPTHAPGMGKRYLDRKPPQPAQPLDCWPGRKHAPDFWRNDKDEWRAWTWELRSEDFSSPDVDEFVAWTCPPDIYEQLMEKAEGATGARAAWFAALAEKYEPGGVARLVEDYKKRQSVP